MSWQEWLKPWIAKGSSKFPALLADASDEDFKSSSIKQKLRAFQANFNRLLASERLPEDPTLQSALITGLCLYLRWIRQERFLSEGSSSSLTTSLKAIKEYQSWWKPVIQFQQEQQRYPWPGIVDNWIVDLLGALLRSLQQAFQTCSRLTGKDASSLQTAIKCFLLDLLRLLNNHILCVRAFRIQLTVDLKLWLNYMDLCMEYLVSPYTQESAENTTARTLRLLPEHVELCRLTVYLAMCLPLVDNLPKQSAQDIMEFYCQFFRQRPTESVGHPHVVTSLVLMLPHLAQLSRQRMRSFLISVSEYLISFAEGKSKMKLAVLRFMRFRLCGYPYWDTDHTLSSGEHRVLLQFYEIWKRDILRSGRLGSKTTPLLRVMNLERFIADRSPPLSDSFKEEEEEIFYHEVVVLANLARAIHQATVSTLTDSESLDPASSSLFSSLTPSLSASFEPPSKRTKTNVKEDIMDVFSGSVDSGTEEKCLFLLFLACTPIGDESPLTLPFLLRSVQDLNTNVQQYALLAAQQWIMRCDLKEETVKQIWQLTISMLDRADFAELSCDVIYALMRRGYLHSKWISFGIKRILDSFDIVKASCPLLPGTLRLLMVIYPCAVNMKQESRFKNLYFDWFLGTMKRCDSSEIWSLIVRQLEDKTRTPLQTSNFTELDAFEQFHEEHRYLWESFMSGNVECMISKLNPPEEKQLPSTCVVATTEFISKLLTEIEAQCNQESQKTKPSSFFSILLKHLRIILMMISNGHLANQWNLFNDKFDTIFSQVTRFLCEQWSQKNMEQILNVVQGIGESVSVTASPGPVISSILFSSESFSSLIRVLLDVQTSLLSKGFNQNQNEVQKNNHNFDDDHDEFLKIHDDTSSLNTSTFNNSTTITRSTIFSELYRTEQFYDSEKCMFCLKLEIMRVAQVYLNHFSEESSQITENTRPVVSLAEEILLGFAFPKMYGDLQLSFTVIPVIGELMRQAADQQIFLEISQELNRVVSSSEFTSDILGRCYISEVLLLLLKFADSDLVQTKPVETVLQNIFALFTSRYLYGQSFPVLFVSIIETLVGKCSAKYSFSDILPTLLKQSAFSKLALVSASRLRASNKLEQNINLIFSNTDYSFEPCYAVVSALVPCTMTYGEKSIGRTFGLLLRNWKEHESQKMILGGLSILADHFGMPLNYLLSLFSDFCAHDWISVHKSFQEFPAYLFVGYQQISSQIYYQVIFHSFMINNDFTVLDEICNKFKLSRNDVLLAWFPQLFSQMLPLYFSPELESIASLVIEKLVIPTIGSEELDKLLSLKSTAILFLLFSSVQTDEAFALSALNIKDINSSKIQSFYGINNLHVTQAIQHFMTVVKAPSLTQYLSPHNFLDILTQFSITFESVKMPFLQIQHLKRFFNFIGVSMELFADDLLLRKTLHLTDFLLDDTIVLEVALKLLVELVQVIYVGSLPVADVLDTYTLRLICRYRKVSNEKSLVTHLSSTLLEKIRHLYSNENPPLANILSLESSGIKLNSRQLFKLGEKIINEIDILCDDVFLKMRQALQLQPSLVQSNYHALLRIGAAVRKSSYKTADACIMWAYDVSVLEPSFFNLVFTEKNDYQVLNLSNVDLRQLLDRNALQASVLGVWSNDTKLITNCASYLQKINVKSTTGLSNFEVRTMEIVQKIRHDDTQLNVAQPVIKEFDMLFENASVDAQLFQLMVFILNKIKYGNRALGKSLLFLANFGFKPVMKELPALFVLAVENSQMSCKEFQDIIFDSRWKDRKALSYFLDTVLSMRTRQLTSKFFGSDFWKEFDYHRLCQMAIKCKRYEDALFFFENWYSVSLQCGQEPTDSVQKFKPLKTIYTNLSDTDFLYCTHQFMEKHDMFTHLENQSKWDMVFALRNANILCKTDNTSLPLLEAMCKQGFGPTVLRFMGQSEVLNDEESCEFKNEWQYEAAWKLGVWDMPCVEDVGPNAQIYYQLSQITAKPAWEFYENSKHLGLLVPFKEVRRILDSNEISLGDHESWLRYFKSVKNSCSFDKMETCFAARAAAYEKLSTADNINVVVRLLTKYSSFARKNGKLQMSLNLIERAQSLLQHFGQKSFHLQLERAKVLYDLKETQLAITMLQDVANDQKCFLNNDDMVCLKRKLIEWIAASNSEPAESIIHSVQNCVHDIEVSAQTSSNTARQLASFQFRFASIAEQQYCDSQKQVVYESLDNVCRRQRREIVQSEALLHANSSKLEKKKLEQHIRRLQAQLNLDENEFATLKTERQSFLQAAVSGYLKAAQFSDKYDLSLYRWLSLWFENAHDEKLNQLISDSILKIPAHKFLSFLYQLSARISDDNDPFRQNISSLIVHITAAFPVDGLLILFALKNARYNINVRANNQSKNLGVTTSLASDATGNRIKCAETVIIQIANQSQTLAHTVYELQKLCDAYNEMAYKDLKADKTANIRLDGPNPIPRTWKIAQIHLLKHIPVLTLHKRTAGDDSHAVYIQQFANNFNLVGGVNLPKVVDCIGTDGRTYRQLLKGRDDLRQDAVLQQVFGAVQSIFNRQRDPTIRKHLHLRRYAVIPLSSRSGVLEWVNNTIPIGSWLQDAHQRYHPQDWTAKQCRETMRKESENSTWTRQSKKAVFQEILAHFNPVLRHFFWERFFLPQDWLEARSRYTRSVATSSVVGYMLGLGDRHSFNILLDQNTAEVIHIDLGIAFDQGKTLMTPELVPFRLTNDIVDGMGISQTTGLFQRAFENTLSLLRDEQKVIMTILEVLKHDPLYTWTLSPAKRHQEPTNRQPESILDNPDTSLHSASDENCESGENEEAKRALLGVLRKLNPSMNVSCQTNELIHEARNPSNLAMMYHGWQPWL